jgi:hypothetical protein
VAAQNVKREAGLGCEECRSLVAHEFRSPDDLIAALRVAAEETNRGVLAAVEDERPREAAEQEAVYSALAAGAVPTSVLYRFRCTVCGQRFILAADVGSGTGSWEAAR